MGEALVALKHEELKEMGILSVGHRLTILKSVYEIKIKQDVPIDPDNYLPPCEFSDGETSDVMLTRSLAAEASLNDQAASLDDISRLIRSIKIRDDRLFQLEAELRRTNDEFLRLNTELKPVFQMLKNQSNKPLPYYPPAASPNDVELNDNMTSPALSQGQPEKSGSSLSRKFSKKGLFLNSTSKSNSPTYIPSSVPEVRSATENSNLDPSAAAVAATNYLGTASNGGLPTSTSPNTITIPSPTSPNTYANQPTLHSRAYPGQIPTPNTARPYPTPVDETREPYMSGTTMVESDRERSNATPSFTSSRQRQRDRDEVQSSNQSVRSGGETPSVEIFKSFRVSMEDPCWKVLPAALKKYQINADWRQYALYIVYGDQERCLGLEEKPLILFKQLDREGKKPMFMLRRHAAPMEGHSQPTSGAPGVGYDTASLGGRGPTTMPLPGGVL